jgi:hypothetical protein
MYAFAKRRLCICRFVSVYIYTKVKKGILITKLLEIVIRLIAIRSDIHPIRREPVIVYHHLSGDRVRLDIRIQRLPDERHALAETVRIEGSCTDLRTQCFH